MKKNKTRIIVLSILFMALCIFPIGFVYFSPNKYNIKDNNEEINLGAAMVVDDGAGGSGKSIAKDAGKSTSNNNNSSNNSSSNNSSNNNSSNKGKVDVKPCCSTCDGNAFCKANCTECVDGKDGRCKTGGSGLFSAIERMTDPDCNESIGEATLDWIEKHQDPCNFVSVSTPGELSPDSRLTVYISVDNGSIPKDYSGGTCKVSANVNNNPLTVNVEVPNSKLLGNNIDFGTGWPACKKVSITTSKGTGSPTTKEIPVKNNFSEETKRRKYNSSEVPATAADADKDGKSYYGTCDAQGCDVHLRGCDVEKPSCYYKEDVANKIWSYCYGTNCGDGYVSEPNVKESDCIDVCYCSEEKNYCGVWAKKGWEGYEIVVDSNGKYITDPEKCVMPPKYSYCCVDNGTLALSANAEYKEKVQTKSCPANWTLLENVSKEDCKIVSEELGSCNMSDISPSKQTGEANGCEGTVSIKVDEGKKCTNTINNENTNFYEISCAKTVNTNFDYGNDGKENTVRSLYKGEGFAFKINVETTVNCKYVFYEEIWSKAYNSVKDSIKKIDSKLLDYLNNKDEWKKYIDNNILNKNGVNDASKLYWYWDVAEKLRDVVKAYNEYKPNDKYNENSRITLETKEKNKNLVTTHELIRTIADEGLYQTSEVSKKNLNVSGVTNPQSYILSSKTPRKIVLMPKRACVDKSTGKIITVEGGKCPTNTLDGGNKIYINSATDVTSKGSYPINIKVEGLGANDSSVINNKCDLKVEEGKYMYRPIDVENPFISADWQKGKNWINETFDFTKVIHSNTWSDNSSKKVITLTAKEISSLKESNNRAWKDSNSPYLGLCDKQSVKLQDEITKKLCSLIK